MAEPIIEADWVIACDGGQHRTRAARLQLSGMRCNDYRYVIVDIEAGDVRQ